MNLIEHGGGLTSSVRKKEYTVLTLSIPDSFISQRFHYSSVNLNKIYTISTKAIGTIYYLFGATYTNFIFFKVSPNYSIIMVILCKPNFISYNLYLATNLAAMFRLYKESDHSSPNCNKEDSDRFILKFFYFY